MTTSRKWLLNAGFVGLLAPAGLAIVLVALHGLGVINAWVFPLIHVGIFCLFGGVGCLVAVQVLDRRTAQSSSDRHHPWRRRLCWGLAILLVSLNVPTYLLAHHMTYVRAPGQLGIGVPKPSNSKTPADRGVFYATRTIPISQSEWLETWEIAAQTGTSRGTVLLFPGRLGTKSSQLIPPAQSFASLGFDTILVDFRGVGGSSGNAVTLGIHEAEDVVTVFNHIKKQNAARGNADSPVVLYGVSMGTAAILRAIAIHKISPDAIILELPFVRLLDAIQSRLRYRKIPAFPTANLLIFWASVQHGINGFTHNPIRYAKAVNAPTLVIHGEQDKWTPVQDIETLVDTLPATTQLVLSADAGHHQLIGVDRPLWDASLRQFLSAF